MNHNEHLDNLLDEALSEYCDAEPLAGIESRLLLRLQASQPTRTNSWLRWGLAAACLAALALVIWIGMARRTSPTATPADELAAQPKTVPQPREFSAPAPGPAVVSENGRARDAAPRRATPSTITPANTKPATAEVFPVPVPLTDEERAFVAALGQHPEAVHATSASDDAPVIAKIEIKPLSTTDENPGDDQ